MGVTLHPIRDSEHAISWFATEHPVLQEAIAEAAGAGFDAHAWQLAWALPASSGSDGCGGSYSYGLLGDFRRSLDHCQQSLFLHDQAGNPRGQAAAWDSCGFAHHHLGDHPEAVACYQRALKLYAEAGDTGNQARARVRLPAGRRKARR